MFGIVITVYVKDFKVVKIQKKGECKSKHEARTKRDDHEYIISNTLLRS